MPRHAESHPGHIGPYRQSREPRSWDSVHISIDRELGAEDAPLITCTIRRGNEYRSVKVEV